MSGETDAALRAAAEAATPGPWTTDDPRNAAGLARVWQYRGLGIAECRYRGTDNHKDAAFIAAANPAAIPDLLDRVEAAVAKVARVEALLAPHRLLDASRLRAALGDPQ